MSKLYECDRCGDIVRGNETYSVTFSIYKGNDWLDRKEADLCGSCYEEMLEFTRKEDEHERVE